MSRWTKREMAPPPNQIGSAPSYHIGSAPASANQAPTPVPAAWWPGPLPQATSSEPHPQFGNMATYGKGISISTTKK